MTTAEETRTYGVRLELRDVQAIGKAPYKYLEGRAVPYDVFETISWFREQHAQDSFKQSTKGGSGTRLPLLLFHDNRSFPIGHAEKWTHDDGLNGVWQLNDSPEAQRAATMAEAGDLVGMSVGFQPIRSAWDFVEDWAPELGPEHMDRVTRLESRLVEVSLTPTPAFQDAEVLVVRSALGHGMRADGAPVPRKSDVEAWREVVDGLRSG
jgi:hypothetical protein